MFLIGAINEGGQEIQVKSAKPVFLLVKDFKKIFLFEKSILQKLIRLLVNVFLREKLNLIFYRDFFITG